MEGISECSNSLFYITYLSFFYSSKTKVKSKGKRIEVRMYRNPKWNSFCISEVIVIKAIAYCMWSAAKQGVTLLVYLGAIRSDLKVISLKSQRG